MTDLFLHDAYLASTNALHTIKTFLDRALTNPVVTTVELLLIGSVVYVVLSFLRGTRGARLVRAVMTILAVSFALVWLIAERFGFERITVIYPYFLLGVFLVSLVAFQTELRRLLLRLGEGGWLDRWVKDKTTTIDPIVTAVERLAARKIGALIAVERSTEVGAVTESGVRLNARLSAELLETIFQPGAPLHDLGVIIRNDTILAASCQFPLAESGEVDRSLGSRHRAGLGMSYEADAIVVIVSEETGAISLAVRGKFEQSLSPKRLRRRLAEELEAGASGGDGGDATKLPPHLTDSTAGDEPPTETISIAPVEDRPAKATATDRIENATTGGNPGSASELTEIARDGTGQVT